MSSLIVNFSNLLNSVWLWWLRWERGNIRDNIMDTSAKPIQRTRTTTQDLFVLSLQLFLTEMSNGSPFKNCSPNHHKFITPPISLIDYLSSPVHRTQPTYLRKYSARTTTIDSDSYWFIFNLAYFRFFICRVPRVETTRHKRGRCLRQFEPQRGHKVNHWTCTGSWTSTNPTSPLGRPNQDTRSNQILYILEIKPSDPHSWKEY